jgi:hypothetical protein
VVQAEVTTAGDTSLDVLLREAGSPKDFDFLCIDVEGNDYNLWDSLIAFEPRVMMVDFNPTVPNDVLFAQEDDPGINHGASLRAFVELAGRKGYELAAVTTWNAIFVRRGLFPAVGLSGNKLEDMYYPVFETKIFQSMDSFLTIQGCDRLIRHNYVLDPERMQPVPPDLRRPADAASFGSRPSTFFEPN